MASRSGPDRIGTVKSTLPDGDLILHHIEAAEELGRPFQFEVELLKEDDKLDLEAMLGKPMTVSVKTRDSAQRHFHGLVSHFSFGGMHGRQVRYVAVLRPWFWFLSHRSDNRIFQSKNVPDIIKEIFQDHGQSAKLELTEKYADREYCVQYGETDFNFVSRLMEEEGIYYYFKHSAGKHEMVLVDSVSSHGPFDEYENIPYFSPDANTPRDLDHISHWECMHQVESNIAVMQSYNFEKPGDKLTAKKEEQRKHAKSGGELYEYGKLYEEESAGRRAVRNRVEEQQSAYKILTGGGNVMGACCGHTFKLEKFPLSSQNSEYLIIGTNIQIQNNEVEAGLEGEEASFNCFFRAIPSDGVFRPAKITPKAMVHGPQTAVVVGPSGEEIYADKYGRVKIQFHWDRLGKKDENSSCMVRVSTAVAGKNWGMIAIPRIGQEVIVDFLEGDPDQPIIVGSVYNKDQMPPYALPANMTQSGYQSRSTKAGSASTFNEIRFEDKKDSEEVFVQAEKDFKRVVKNNDVLEVGLEKKDKGDQTIVIHNDRTVTLKEGSDKLKVKKKIMIEAGDVFEVKVGQAKLTLKKNGEVTIKGMNINIKGNGSVKVNGASVKIDGKGEVGIKGGGQTKVEGSGMLDLKGGGMAKLKGGVTMIG